MRITAALGAEAGIWSLEITTPKNKTKTIKGLRPVSPSWRTLNYIGYISNAAQTSEFCLAGLRITNINDKH